MTTYAEVHGTTLILYPYLFSTLQEQNPYTNFGDNYDVAYWFPQTQMAIENGYTLDPVTILPEPRYDSFTQNCVTNTTPECIDGKWFLDWIITQKTSEEQAKYIENIKKNNKRQAMQHLSTTDWTAIPSVGDASQSNPYLENQAAFLAYRSQVRSIAVNPPSTPVESWPALPDEVWRTA
jgi:hypothetical protein